MTALETSSDEGVPDFERLFAAEKRHFWFCSRNAVIGRMVRSLTTDLPAGYRVLEVGCGTGNVLRELEQVCKGGEVIGLDLFDEGLQFARQRTSCRLVQADIHDMPFDAPFDVVGMFDVLEHLPDDHRALQDVRKALAPSGRLLLTVPAHMGLWSHTDVCAHHYRRYSLGRLRQVLTASGFRVDYASEFMMALFPVMWLQRRAAVMLRRLGGGATPDARALALRELRVVPGFNLMMTLLLTWEARVIARRWTLPLGTSILAVASRADADPAAVDRHAA
jgi:SAM-dependent methyltransferase